MGSVEKETCPAKATCLFRLKLRDFVSNPWSRTGLAAARMCSRWSRLRSLVRASCPFASAVRRLPLCRGLVCMFIGPNMFSTACRTFCSVSVGLISTSTWTVTISILVQLLRGLL